MKTLRPYQNAALKSLWHWLENNEGNPLVVAPVGAGKSLMIAEFIKQAHDFFPRTRIVMLTHVKELLEQNAEELLEQYKGVDFGFYCAGLNQKRLHNDITFASIQSVHNKLGDFNRTPDIIIIDECHLISHKGNTQYRKFIDAVQAINPYARAIGFTGTPFRADTGRLTEGQNKLFDDVAYEIGMDFMIGQGYWAKPVCPAVATKMDVSGVKVRGGDYVAGELERAVNTHEINDACVKELLELGKDRKKWLVFTAGIQHCEDVCQELHNAGVTVAHITGDTPKQERIANIERFRRGEIRCLVNVAVLTTGFNVPDIDLLAFMRPTRSPVLYIQTIGRGVRPVYEGDYDLSTQEGRLASIANSRKPDCMVLDFGGVVDALGPIDAVSIEKTYQGEKERDGKGDAIIKICPSCGAECAASQRYCYNCSHCFIKLDEKSDNKAIVTSDEKPEWWDVIAMSTDIHEKPGKTRSMRVSYHCLTEHFKEWICFEHSGYAQQKSRAWHEKFKPHDKQEFVADVKVATMIDYKTPSRILVKRDGKYWRVIDYEFNAEENELFEEITF